MQQVPWTEDINFASALLLHSCITVLLKESLNLIQILWRTCRRWWPATNRKSHDCPEEQIKTSIVLDAYTSIVSNDRDGELAELYFTNTGCLLLAISLAASVAMNVLLPDLALNLIVACTFAMAFLASMINNGKLRVTLPIIALRRAGRFIWSDTPFVNFFTLIYIATVRHGQASLRLQDYVTFRTIAVLELVFMKAKLAASSPETQTQLLERLLESEWVAVKAHVDHQYHNKSFSSPHRNDMVPFKSRQRLSVMLFKTTIGFDQGCLIGELGPATVPLPPVHYYNNGPDNDWKVYRLSEDVFVLADCYSSTTAKTSWARFIARAHGVLLRQLGKVRVIYFLRQRRYENEEGCPLWHCNINLVTGITKEWLDKNFELAAAEQSCVVAGVA